MSQKFESVVMYGSWLEVARSKLPEDDVCRLMVQLMEYGLTGKIPENENVIMATIFEMAKPNIDSNIRKKINGKKGGRKPGGQPGNKNAENEKKRITYGLSNANVNGNANANANDNANDNDIPSAGASVPVSVTEDAASEIKDDDGWMVGTRMSNE